MADPRIVKELLEGYVAGRETRVASNVGIIELSQQLLLKFLQYPDGVIRAIDIPPDRVGIIRIQLEHPEMPEFREGDYIPVITPVYVAYEDCLGHKVTIRETKNAK